MALAALVNLPFLFNNLVYFISERFFPKTREIVSLVVRPWEMKKKIVRLTAEPWELAGLGVFAIRQRTELTSLALFCSQPTPKAELWKLLSLSRNVKRFTCRLILDQYQLTRYSPREKRRKRGMGIATTRIPKPLPLSNPTTPTQDGTQLSRKHMNVVPRNTMKTNGETEN